MVESRVRPVVSHPVTGNATGSGQVARPRRERRMSVTLSMTMGRVMSVTPVGVCAESTPGCAFGCGLRGG
jgi:hypothetical protein